MPAVVCWLCRYRKTSHLVGCSSKDKAIRAQAQVVLGRRDTEPSTKLENSLFFFFNVFNVMYYMYNWAPATLVLESSSKVYLTAGKKAGCRVCAKDIKLKDICNLINTN